MTTQSERLHHLLDRLLRGVLLPEEREQLAALVRELEAEVASVTRTKDLHVAAWRTANRRADTLEVVVARVRRAVDAGPVGSCCAHLIRAALNPPRDLCGCGRPDPGPCTPCPAGSPSLHCACVCAPTVTKEIA